ncbi:DUF533 domain-containing protein [Loktanella sp. Alg231-35]|uniref:tellurite resistance TerB family protein n=1 Tax=Loktanella sp. Alg231-35 TaxID=1922220 RepID=UPI000D55FADA|nr:DUF533 domain-containing protein [Loktanella sp. Alg231-35]
MRHFVSGLFMAIVLTSMATQADARRGGGYGTAEQLVFVSPTEFEDETGPLALCHFVETHSIIFVNVWRSLTGYALASNNCQSEQYYEFTATELESAQAAGMIPADVPLQPKLSMKSLAEGFWGFGLLIAVLAFAGFKLLAVQKRRGQRIAIMADATPAAQAILDAMCHAAKADGYIAPSEVAMIKQAAEEMTGTIFAMEDVKRMADLAEETLDLKGHKRLINGRTKPEQLDMMRGVLMVVAADGKLDGKEQVFVGGLARAMGMDGGTVQSLMAEVVGGAAAPA